MKHCWAARICNILGNWGRTQWHTNNGCRLLSIHHLSRWRNQATIYCGRFANYFHRNTSTLNKLLSSLETDVLTELFVDGISKGVIYKSYLTFLTSLMPLPDWNGITNCKIWYVMIAAAAAFSCSLQAQTSNILTAKLIIPDQNLNWLHPRLLIGGDKCHLDNCWLQVRHVRHV